MVALFYTWLGPRCRATHLPLFNAGVVVAGVSAGALCWFAGGVTDSFGGLARLDDGLAFVDGTMCPHFDGEPRRRPTYHTLVAEGMPAGWAADDVCYWYL